MNILVVDDISTNRKLLGAILEAEDHSVIEAIDGMDALAVLEREKVDAIISDILMPRMDGYRLCWEIRRNERFKNLPFIFYTATYTSASDEKLCFAVGGDKYLRKPSSAEEILAALRFSANVTEPRKSNWIGSPSEFEVMKEYSESLVTKLEQKNSELSLAEEVSSQLAAIVNSSNDAIIGTNLDGVVTSWNSGAEQIFGYFASEMIGTPITRLIPVERQGEELEIMKRIKNGERIVSFDTVRMAKGGGLIEVSIMVSPIKDKNDKIIGASKIARDIRERKQLEAQFIEAQKMEVVGQLAGGVAHDFNNVLGVIMGYNDLMVDELGAENPLQKYMEEIRTASIRASGLTRQLLVFSRNQVVQTIVLDLNEVVQDMDKMLSRLVDEHIELKLVLEKQLGHIKADSGYLGQLLMNLVINARDAMPNGGQLTIETANTEPDKNYFLLHPDMTPSHYVVLSVRDTGTGMTEEIKARLFEAFFTTKPKGKGTGLGLATCQTIAKQSNAQIHVESEPGKGTTFKVYFPRVDQALHTTTRHLRLSSPIRGSETVLIVEDEAALRKMTSMALTNQGYIVLQAATGQEGLRVANEHKVPPIALVITDVIMPEMGGKVMAEWLKASYPHIKVLFTSGYTDASIVQHGVLDPTVAFLPKPYTLATLTGKVREVLDG